MKVSAMGSQHTPQGRVQLNRMMKHFGIEPVGEEEVDETLDQE
jgi:hypothetical protein